MNSYLDGLRTDAGVGRDFAALLRGARKADRVRAGEPAELRPPGARDLGGRRQALPAPLVERSRTFVPENNSGALVELLRDFLA